MLKTREEYDRLRKRAETLPIDDLINEPDCDHNCPPCRPDGCDCCFCHEHKGYYKNGEMNVRNFTENEIEMINEMLEKPEGCLGEKGCMLPRRLRSEACLRARCNPYEKPAGNWR